jgi:hypothetical protein
MRVKTFEYEGLAWEVLKTGKKGQSASGVMGGDWWEVTIR